MTSKSVVPLHDSVDARVEPCGLDIDDGELLREMPVDPGVTGVLAFVTLSDET